MLRFAAGREAAIAAVQSPLREPGVIDDGGWRAALAMSQGVPDERVMPIVPGRFDEHAPQMRVAGLGDRAVRPSGATRMF